MVAEQRCDPEAYDLTQNTRESDVEVEEQVPIRQLLLEMAKNIAVLKIAHVREPWQKLKPRSEVLDKEYDRVPLEEAPKTSSYTTGGGQKVL